MQTVSVSTVAPGTVLVRLRGEIDFTNSAGVAEVIRGAVLRDRPTALRADLAELTFLDSSGIGVLINAMKAADEVGASFTVEHPSSKVLSQLRMTGLLEVFGLADPPR